MLLSGKIWNAISRKATAFVQLIRFCVSFTHVIILNFCQYPIRNSTMTNGIVLDPFLGSGSTLIACEETDRVCRGIELDPKFVDVIVKRYIEHSEGHYDDVFVIRDGQKLKFEEVATFEPESEDTDA